MNMFPKVPQRNTSESVLRQRLAAFAGYSHNGDRDMYDVFGYPRGLAIEHLFAMYRRNELAGRIIRAFPQATWSEMPIIKDEKGSSWEKKDNKGNKNLDFSPFAKAARDLMKKFNVMSYMERVDRLASVGRFGVLVMGFAGEVEFSQPLTGKAELLYLTPYSEIGITIDKFCEEPGNPRYGMIEIYNIQPGRDESTGAKPMPTKSIRVHHSRVLHISEFLDSDEVYGEPRLSCIYNRLVDCEKVMGGSAETFWITANRGMHIDVDPEVIMDEDDIERVREQTEAIQHKLKRQIFTQGTKITNLGSDAPDPEPNMDKLLQLISGGANIPMRILTGSERGELASGMDDDNWSATIRHRRHNYAALVLKAFLQKMIDTGNLIAPKGEFEVEWKQPDMPIDKQANAASAFASAIATYSNAVSAPLIVPEQEFRSKYLGLPPESEFETQLDPVEEADVDPNDPEAKDQFDKSKGKEAPAEEREPAANMAPKPLYAFRPVLNRAAIIKWAKEQGLELLAPDALHVTLMHSRTPVDWMKAGQSYGEDEDGRLMLHPDGKRVLERFGKDGNLIVLSFISDELMWRHERLKQLGCAWDWQEYQPHITLVADPDHLIDLSKITPYKGAIALGPEEFTDIEG